MSDIDPAGLLEWGQEEREEHEARDRALLLSSARAFASRRQFTRDDLTKFDRLASPLFEKADDDTRTQVSVLLSSARAVPVRLCSQIVCAPSAVSTPFIVHAAHIPRLVLNAIVRKLTPGHAAAVARRGGLPQETVDLLLRRNSRAVFTALVKNRNFPIIARHFKVLAKAAYNDAEIANAMFERSDINRSLLARCFFDVNFRRQLEIAAAVSSIRPYVGTYADRIARLRQDNPGIVGQILSLDQEYDSEALTDVIANLVGLPPAQARQLATDYSGLAMLILLRALAGEGHDGRDAILSALARRAENMDANRMTFERVYDSMPQASATTMLAMWAGHFDVVDRYGPRDVITASNDRAAEQRQAPEIRGAQAIRSIARRLDQSRHARVNPAAE